MKTDLTVLLVVYGAIIEAVSAVVPSTAQWRPAFISRPGLFSVREGDAVILPCNVRHAGDYSVVWQQGKRVLTARHLIVDSDSRLSLVDGHNLRIEGVARTDATNFTCSISTKPMMELTHTVDVLYGPVVRTVPETGQLITSQGDNATLECTAEGNPESEVAWQKQRGELPSGAVQSPGRLLHIQHISREMAGVYECVARNGLGTPGVGTVSVQVQYAPEVKVESSTIYTGEEHEVNVVCFVFADPPAKVSWERQGFEFDPDRHSTPRQEVGSTRHTLTIQHVRAEDFGTYSCHASNRLGTAHGTMSLTGVPGRAVITSGAISTAPELYELSWEVESFSPVQEYKVAYMTTKVNGTGALTPRWREVKVPPTGSQTSTGTLFRQQIPLSKLQPATSYELYVQAKNKHGWSAVSDTLHFSTIARGEALESRSLSSAAGRVQRRLAVLRTALLSTLIPLLVNLLTLC